MLRIIAGERRGALIQAPAGQTTRPLRDRIRQALFNIWQFDIAGRRALDLFAGSGALGLEALSRGATEAVFIESDGAARAAIEANVRKLRYEDRVRMVAGLLPSALDQAGTEPFGLVFIAPPYHTGAGTECLRELSTRRLVDAESNVVLEIHREEGPPDLPGWAVESERLYGVTKLVFLRFPA